METCHILHTGIASGTAQRSEIKTAWDSLGFRESKHQHHQHPIHASQPDLFFTHLFLPKTVAAPAAMVQTSRPSSKLRSLAEAGRSIAEDVSTKNLHCLGKNGWHSLQKTTGDWTPNILDISSYDILYMDVSYGYILWYLMYLMDVSWPVQYEPNPNFGCQYFVYLAQVLVHHHTMHSSFFGDLLHLLWRAFLKTCLEQMSSQPLPFGSAHKIDIALPGSGCWARLGTWHRNHLYAGSETPPGLGRPLTCSLQPRGATMCNFSNR